MAKKNPTPTKNVDVEDVDTKDNDERHPSEDRFEGDGSCMMSAKQHEKIHGKPGAKKPASK